MMQPAAINGPGPAELVGAEQRAYHDIAPGADATIDLDGNTAAQPVADQRLMGLGETDFPGRAGMLDRRQAGSAGAASSAGNQDVIRVRL